MITYIKYGLYLNTSSSVSISMTLSSSPKVSVSSLLQRYVFGRDGKISL